MPDTLTKGPRPYHRATLDPIKRRDDADSFRPIGMAAARVVQKIDPAAHHALVDAGYAPLREYVQTKREG